MKFLYARVALFFIIGILLLSLLGCSKQYPKDPTDVVIAFFMALFEKDYNGAKRYCTNNFISNDFNSIQSTMKDVTDAMNNPVFDNEVHKKMEMIIKSGYEDLQSTIIGNEAHIEGFNDEATKFILVKDGPKWKLDRTETYEAAEPLTQQFEQ